MKVEYEEEDPVFVPRSITIHIETEFDLVAVRRMFTVLHQHYEHGRVGLAKLVVDEILEKLCRG